MNIILIGFMGSGKSSVGKLLSQRVKKKHIEMDDYILKKSKRRSINEIFEKDGEILFRELEINMSKKLQNIHEAIISTGGGIVMNKINLDYLRQNGKVIFLDTLFETVEERLKNDTKRPNFQDKEKAKQLFLLRKNLYQEYAERVIKTDNKTIEEIVNEIIT